MDRRELLRIAMGSATTLCVGCGSHHPMPGRDLSTRQRDDIRLRVLQYAVLAPSSHNTQPWLVRLTPDGGLRLYADHGRLLPATDPPARQTHISQGTFLEVLEIAAHQFGYAARIDYFPEGEYSNSRVENRPFASVLLRPDTNAAPDPLFAEIRKRQTNKRPYDAGRPPSAAELASIRSASGMERFSTRIVTSAAQRASLAAICEDAMAIEVSSRWRNRETGKWFRFSDRELRQKRDGFGIAQNGTEGMKKWIAETFVLSREKAEDPNGSFAHGAVSQAAEQASSAPAFVALISASNTRLEQVLAGRAYIRAHLTASRLGLAMQPLSQALEEYSEMTPVRKRLKATLDVAGKQTIQMLFRLGHAAPTAESPRRDIRDLVLQRAALNLKLNRVIEG